MREHELDHDVIISGARCRTLASAASALRRHAVDCNDFKGWRLSRELRDADTYSQAALAEQKLNAWIAAAACEKELLHYCVCQSPDLAAVLGLTAAMAVTI